MICQHGWPAMTSECLKNLTAFIGSGTFASVPKPIGCCLTRPSAYPTWAWFSMQRGTAILARRLHMVEPGPTILPICPE